MTNPIDALSSVDSAENLINDAGDIVVNPTVSFLNEIVTSFSGIFSSYQSLIQLGVIAFAAFVAYIVHKLVGARVKAEVVHIGSDGWKHKLIRIGLNTLYDVLFSATAAALLSLCVWVLSNSGLISVQGDLFLIRLAYQIFYAWALLLVLLQFLGALLGGKMFARGLRRIVGVAFWILAALQILDVLPAIVDWMKSFQLPIGSDKLTVWALLVGLVTLFLSLGIAARISDLCENAIMKMPDMEMNIRVVFARLCRVAFLVLGVLIGLSSAGINLTVLSVFGGALGVGIGFGMQKIASNYISGFIILCDKSVKIGDLVEVSGFSGIVTQINTRYSVLRNTSGEELIVPNENFVTGSVKNFSHSDAASLVKITVSCAYESNVDEALRILQDCVLAHPRTLNEPDRKPWVAVTEFAASGITLCAGFWIADPRQGTVVLKSDILRSVQKAYAEAGIEIPYDKLDVTIRSAS